MGFVHNSFSWHPFGGITVARKPCASKKESVGPRISRWFLYFLTMCLYLWVPYKLGKTLKTWGGGSTCIQKFFTNTLAGSDLEQQGVGPRISRWFLYNEDKLWSVILRSSLLALLFAVLAFINLQVLHLDTILIRAYTFAHIHLKGIHIWTPLYWIN